jgi:hypothetical protein
MHTPLGFDSTADSVTDSLVMQTPSISPFQPARDMAVGGLGLTEQVQKRGNFLSLNKWNNVDAWQTQTPFQQILENRGTNQMFGLQGDDGFPSCIADIG